MTNTTDARVRITGKDVSGRAFKNARNNLKSLTRATAAAAAAASAMAAAGFAVVKNTTNQTRSILAYADALGVSTENMTRWQFAAERVGLEGDKVADIMKDAADKIGDAFRNNAGEAKEAVESLGLDLEQLAAMTPDQQLLALAGALESVETNAEKVQIMESIGNDLSLMLPLLENNAKGLKDAADQADALGVTITQVEADKIRIADEAIKDIESSFDTLGQQLTVFSADYLPDIAKWFGSAIPATVEYATLLIDGLGATFAALWEQMNPSGITGSRDFTEAFDAYMEAAKIARQKAEDELYGGVTEVEITSDETNQVAVDALQSRYMKELEITHAFEDAKTAAVRKGVYERKAFSMMAASEQTKHIIGETIRLTRGVTGESRKLFEINKAAGIANALVSAYEGYNKSLAAYPYPLNVVMAGLSLSAGLAAVSAIKSQSFNGGGGSGGPPSSAASGGTPANPVFQNEPTPSVTENSGPTYQIFVEGQLVGDEQVRQVLVDALEKARDLDEIE